jgi:hypothetical protein
MKTAVWVLTDTRSLFFHNFTCSNCGRIESATKHFTDKGNYDMRATVSELMKEYPYCHCGSKMQRDSQISSKMKQMRRAHKLAAKTWLTDNPVREKTHWKVDEVVEAESI